MTGRCIVDGWVGDRTVFTGGYTSDRVELMGCCGVFLHGCVFFVCFVYVCVCVCVCVCVFVCVCVCVCDCGIDGLVALVPGRSLLDGCGDDGLVMVMSGWLW